MITMQFPFKQIFTVSLLISITTGLTACNQKNEVDATNTIQTVNEANMNSSQLNNNTVQDIWGAGASFPASIYKKWAEEYRAVTGGVVYYDAVGSSSGVKDILSNSVDFGASDRPLTPEELQVFNLIQFPTVISGIVPVINIAGIQAGEMILDGVTLADIYLGKIQKWNDPAIVTLNPTLTLPDEDITTIHRSDGSGSTFNLSHYLDQVSEDWSSVGVGKLLKWPTDTLGTGIPVAMNSGVARELVNNPNSIGYLDYNSVQKYGLTYTAMINASHQIIYPNRASFAAASDVDWQKIPEFYTFINNSSSYNAWPMAMTTFILVNREPKDPKKTTDVLKFFHWAYLNGDQSAIDTNFVPFSETMHQVFIKEWLKIVDKDNNSIYHNTSNQ